MTAKETDALVRQIRKARKDGWEVQRTRSDHFEVLHNGVRVATIAGSGGGGRGLRNARAELKRAGFDFGR